MKFNTQTAVLGLVLLAVVYKVMAARKAQSPTSPTSQQMSQPGQWWSYAGSWGL